MEKEGGNRERMRKCRESISLHFLIFSPFPPHFLILPPFPRSPAARLQRFVQPCNITIMPMVLLYLFPNNHVTVFYWANWDSTPFEINMTIGKGTPMHFVLNSWSPVTLNDQVKLVIPGQFGAALYNLWIVFIILWVVNFLFANNQVGLQAPV